MTAETARTDEEGGPEPMSGRPGAPRHVAIIMDGNGRWAKRRGLPRVAGHRKGVEAAQVIVRAAGDLGIEVLTLYAFSSENWRRPATEIADLMDLLRRFIRRELGQLAEAGIRIKVIGDYHAFESDVVALIDDAIARTADNRRATLAVALNYGSQSELAAVARDLAREAKDGTLDPESIDESTVAARLSTTELPPLDLLIRTSGEKRLSNFLLWQAAYAELHFTDTLWPDFDADELASAIAEFGRRERRFGGL